ncbi:class I histocompatibility antigen, F10 alpha chain-like [Pristis pectinata]|uniref:class I histocompatibility antigen, F10 alpha chain-like n=1 Tax=Pristis pectinata TaxID=685728 RepID=UPI00223D6C5A|nr:class I histocompatibility antigen, F10 alpha chain-like [Pristis pectinata]XP_051899852.1 class I histocompatibility antigen, F10 alpha chain-like [Pristis pectinata]
MEGTGPLRVGLTVLVLLCGGVSAGSRFLRFFLTSTTPIPGFPQVVVVGSVDGVQFMMYDSDRKLVPQDQWMGGSEGAEWWMRKLELLGFREMPMKEFMSFVMSQTNQSSGIHTLQGIFGCDLREDGTTNGFVQYGWDGEDLINFNKGRMMWVSSVPWGMGIQHQCNVNVGRFQKWKDFLERDCVEWLRRFVEYGERELRVVPPQVTFTPSAHNPHLSCLATGFHPPSIEVTLWRDGTILHEAHSSGLLPNHDGTHQIRKWVQVDPEDPGQFSCRVEHSGLEDPIVLVYVRGTHSRLPLILGLLVALIALTIAVGAVYRWRAGVKRNYNPTPTSDGAGSSAGSTASE